VFTSFRCCKAARELGRKPTDCVACPLIRGSCRLFSYLRQGGNVFAGFCLSVCLFVCLCVSKITQKVMNGSTDLSEILRVCWAWHKLPVIQFWGDPAGILDSGSLWNFRYHCVNGGIREPLVKRRWWRHLANNIALAEAPAGYDCFLVFFLFHLVANPIWHQYFMALVDRSIRYATRRARAFVDGRWSETVKEREKKTCLSSSELCYIWDSQIVSLLQSEPAARRCHVVD